MKQGSVVVDLAVETGGNCAASKAGEVVQKHGVTIVGHLNVPSRLAADTSALYARNLLNLLALIIDKDKGALNINWEDDIIKGIALVKDGKLVHPNFKGASKSAAKTVTKSKAAPKSTPKKPAAADAKKPAAKKPATAKKAPAKKSTTTSSPKK
jgi:NAD(P) transhydrogenase subunit alpha